MIGYSGDESVTESYFNLYYNILYIKDWRYYVLLPGTCRKDEFLATLKSLISKQIDRLTSIDRSLIFNLSPSTGVLLLRLIRMPAIVF